MLKDSLNAHSANSCHAKLYQCQNKCVPDRFLNVSAGILREKSYRIIPMLPDSQAWWQVRCFHAKLLFFDLNNGTLPSIASEVLNLNPKPQTLNNYPLTHFLLTMPSPSPAKPKTAHTAPAIEQVWQESTYFNPKLHQLQYYNPKP